MRRLAHALALAAALGAGGCSLLFNGNDLHGHDGGAGGGGGDDMDVGGGDDLAGSDGMTGGGGDMAGGVVGPLTLSFAKSTTSPVAVGDAPYSVAVGDFDGDGKLDLVTANDNSGTLTLLMNAGDATFTGVNLTPSGVPNGCSPYAVTTADFNKDGIADVAVTCTDLANVNGGVIVLGNSGRSFNQKPITYLNSSTTNLKPEAIVAGDFNHDGKVDVAVANAGADSVSIYAGNGDGTFTTIPVTHSLPASAQPRSLAAADLNGDTRDDLVAANNGLSSVTVFLQTSANALPTAGVNYNVGSGPAGIGIADTNGDGKPDLIVPNENDSTISVLLGSSSGDGTFPSAAGTTMPPSYNPGAYALSIALGDFDHDGHVDLVSGAGTQNTVTVMLGDGKGAFGKTQQLDCGPISSSVVTGLFNADMLTDIACTNNSTSNSTITVLLNTSH